MHTIKITPNLLSEYQCSEAANLSDCRIESKLFLPELECSSLYIGQRKAISNTHEARIRAKYLVSLLRT